MVASKPKSSQNKSQQSISSFFTPKSTINGRGSSQASQPSPNQPPPAPKEPAAVVGNLYDADSDDEEPVRPAGGLSKRPLAVATNGGNGGIPERPSKRSKLSDEEANESHAPAEISVITKASQRTKRYMYTSAGHAATETPIQEEDDDVTTRAKKNKLHQKFIQKLGHPDSIAQIKRRNWQITEETEALDGEEADEAEDDTPPPKTKGKGVAKGTKTGKLTPMENQILDIKRKHMDTILIVEVGYKFRFYGEDARIAAKELGIVCIPGKFRYDERRFFSLAITYISNII